MKPFHTSLLVTAPSSEPVTLTQAKKYCRIYQNYEDDVVTALITTARMMTEQYLCRALLPQTLKWTLKPIQTPHAGYTVDMAMGYFTGFLGTGIRSNFTMELPRSPVTAVSSVIVRGNDDVDVTLTSGCYSIDFNLEPARLVIDWSAVNLLSVPPLMPLRHIEVQFVAGYATVDKIPTPIVQSIMMLVNFLYENRADTEGPEMPSYIDALLDPYRIAFFGSGV